MVWKQVPCNGISGMTWLCQCHGTVCHSLFMFASEAPPLFTTHTVLCNHWTPLILDRYGVLRPFDLPPLPPPLNPTHIDTPSFHGYDVPCASRYLSLLFSHPPPLPVSLLPPPALSIFPSLSSLPTFPSQLLLHPLRHGALHPVPQGRRAHRQGAAPRGRREQEGAHRAGERGREEGREGDGNPVREVAQ